VHRKFSSAARTFEVREQLAPAAAAEAALAERYSKRCPTLTRRTRTAARTERPRRLIALPRSAAARLIASSTRALWLLAALPAAASGAARQIDAARRCLR
jgi:hypothetical protein